MKAGTIRMISELLKTEVERMQRREERAREEKRLAEDAMESFREARKRADLDAPVSDEKDLQEMVELARARRTRAAKELAQAQNALEDFEGHDWG